MFSFSDTMCFGLCRSVFFFAENVREDVREEQIRFPERVE